MNTNNTFTLTMPTDDPIALNAFSRALHEMAVAHGAPVAQVTESVPAKLTLPVLTDDEKLAIKEAFDNSRKTYVPEDDANEAFERYVKVVEEDLTSGSHTDSEGLPWDERIHAGSKTRNQDGTWKARKKRQDMSAEEWSDYVTGVKAELKELMNVPVVTPPVPAPEWDELNAIMTDGVKPDVESTIASMDDSDDALPVPPVVDMPVPPVPVVEPEVTQEDVDKLCQGLVDGLKPMLGDKYAHIAVYGKEPPVPVPPVPVVEPEVTVAIEAEQLPPAPPVSDSVTTFPALMTWLTSHESVLTVERVNQVVQSHGLTELKQLIQRPDLIPQVFVTLSQEV